MKSGDFVAIDYVGRVKETGEIFDVTAEEIAKREKVYDEHVSYSPVNVVVDANFVIKGLDDALKDMKVGDKRTIVVEPENAFGPRNPNFVKPIPLSNFKNEKVDPAPGNYVSVNGIRGRVLSVDGGRIRVDFNHPLAGKKLEYDLEVKRELTDAREKVVAIVGYITGLDSEKVHASLNQTEAEIKVDADREMPAGMKKQIADLVIKWVSGVEKIRFVDEYGK